MLKNNNNAVSSSGQYTEYTDAGARNKATTVTQADSHLEANIRSLGGRTSMESMDDNSIHENIVTLFEENKFHKNKPKQIPSA